MMRKSDVQGCLTRFGEALSSGDVHAIADCWRAPALVLSDQDAMPVAKSEEVERFFSQAVDWYRSRGLVATKPQIERIEPFSDKLASVDVRWPAFDAAGSEQASERSHYILGLDGDGKARIRVALSRTE